MAQNREYSQFHPKELCSLAVAPEMRGLHTGISDMTYVPFFPLLQLKLKDETLLAEIHMLQETFGFGNPSF